jgi:hypothetical protein
MSTDIEQERIDTLLALALAFDRGAQRVKGLAENAAPSGLEPMQLESLSELGEDDRRALQRRAQWYSKLGPDKQARWLARILDSVRPQLRQLDAQVHPSHLVEALRNEPPRVQKLVLQHLPPALADACAAALPSAEAQRRAGSAPFTNSTRRKHSGRLGRESKQEDTTPAPELVSLVYRAFLSSFIVASGLRHPSPMDSLSGVELVRLVRLLGVRETAVACRGIERAESVGSFLRRFSVEDARAIAAQMGTLVAVEPQRVAFANQLVQETLSVEHSPEAMLDRLGMRVLAMALAARQDESESIAYLAQKLPVEAARALREMVTESARSAQGGVAQLIAKETETLALSLRVAKAKGRNT